MDLLNYTITSVQDHYCVKNRKKYHKVWKYSILVKKLFPTNLAKAQSLIDVHPCETEHSLFGVLKTNRYIFNFRSEKDIMNVERTFDLLSTV